MDDEIGGGVGADRHEGAVPDRDLPGIADQDVEAERADDRDQDQIEDRDVIFAERQRHDDDEQPGERRHRPFGDRQRVERHVGGIAGLEDPGFAVEHRLTASLPSPPAGGRGAHRER